MKWTVDGVREVLPRGRELGMCEMEGVNGWGVKGRDAPTAPDQECKGDCREIEME